MPDNFATMLNALPQAHWAPKELNTAGLKFNAPNTGKPLIEVTTMRAALRKAQGE